MGASWFMLPSFVSSIGSKKFKLFREYVWEWGNWSKSRNSGEILENSNWKVEQTFGDDLLVKVRGLGALYNSGLVLAVGSASRMKLALAGFCAAGAALSLGGSSVAFGAESFSFYTSKRICSSLLTDAGLVGDGWHFAHYIIDTGVGSDNGYGEVVVIRQDRPSKPNEEVPKPSDIDIRDIPQPQLEIVPVTPTPTDKDRSKLPPFVPTGGYWVPTPKRINPKDLN